jgi:AraC-like DNA-binding protein
MYIQTRNFGYKKSIITLYEDENCNRIPRTHQFSEIQCIIRGSFHVNIDGETVVAKAGDIVVITPFRVHGVKAAEPKSKLWICAVSNDFLSDFVTNEVSFAPAAKFVYTPPKELFEYVKLNMIDTHETVVSLEDNRPMFCKIKAVMYAVFENYLSAVPQSPVEVKNYALATLLLYLNEHFKEDLTRKSVCEAIGYNQSYISHCIEILPNMNFRKLLNSLRVEYAKKLLSSTDYSILKIALECGFQNDRTFYRAFYEIEEISPGDYRKKHRR